MSVRVVLADDQPVVRAGFRVVLEADPGEPRITVVGEASDGPAAVRAAAALCPDVVLMDVRMPGGDGLAATAAVVAAGGDVRVLVVTTFDLDEYVRQALRAGASGFVLKDVDPAELARAVRVVHAGHALLAPTVTTRLVRDWVAADVAAPAVPAPAVPAPGAHGAGAATGGPTGREHDVLVHVAQGMSNAEIADAMVVAETTVKTHVAHLLRKLGCRDRLQLVVHAYRYGLVPVPPP